MGREGKQGQETNSISELPHPNTKKLIIIIIMKIIKKKNIASSRNMAKIQVWGLFPPHQHSLSWNPNKHMSTGPAHNPFHNIEIHIKTAMPSVICQSCLSIFKMIQWPSEKLALMTQIETPLPTSRLSSKMMEELHKIIIN